MTSRYTARVVKRSQAVPSEAQEDLASSPAQNRHHYEQAMQQAGHILADARRQADEIVEAAKLAGRAAGEKTAGVEAILLSTRFQHEIEAFEIYAVDFVIRCVERIIFETPHYERVRGVVRRTIQDFTDRYGLTLNVAPEDIDIARAAVAQYQGDRDHPIRLVKVDETLSAGQSLLVDGRSRLSIGVSSQLAALKEVLSDAGIGGASDRLDAQDSHL